MTPEGRIVNNGTNALPVWVWEYNLTDHLGNTRVVVKPHTTAGYATVLQELNYYPFGMRISSMYSSSTDNDYWYNGKQLQTDFGLNWYDYGARFYDPALARWTTIDPLAEYHFNMTPYNYCLNNPMLYIDPFGLDTLKTDQNGDPHVDLDEVTVTASRPTNSGYMQPYGMWWEGSVGQGNPYRAKSTDYMGSSDHFLNMTGFDWLGFFSIFGKISDAWAEFGFKKPDMTKTKSEKDIKKESTGENTTETDAFGKSVPETDQATEVKNNDSIYVKVTIWKNQNPKDWSWNVRIGDNDSVKVHRKDSAETVKYYDETTF